MFKVGELIRVKSFEEIHKLNEYYGPDYPYFVKDMKKFCGKVFKVSAIINPDSERHRGYGLICLCCDECRRISAINCPFQWNFHEYMLEKAGE